MSPCIPDCENAEWSFYRFKPFVAAAIFFCILFMLTTGFHVLFILRGSAGEGDSRIFQHLFQTIRTKTWCLTVLGIGDFCEIIGYATRVNKSLEKPGCWSLGPYILQSILILIASGFTAASIYRILGVIILLAYGEVLSLISRRWLTKVSVVGDVLSLLLKSSDGSLMAVSGTDNDFMQIGENVIIGGLFGQLTVFGFFVISAGIFRYRMARVPTVKYHNPVSVGGTTSLRYRLPAFWFESEESFV